MSLCVAWEMPSSPCHILLNCSEWVLPSARPQLSGFEDMAVIPGRLFLAVFFLGSVQFLAALHFRFSLLVSQSYLSPQAWTSLGFVPNTVSAFTFPPTRPLPNAKPLPPRRSWGSGQQFTSLRADTPSSPWLLLPGIEPQPYEEKLGKVQSRVQYLWLITREAESSWLYEWEPRHGSNHQSSQPPTSRKVFLQ